MSEALTIVLTTALLLAVVVAAHWFGVAVGQRMVRERYADFETWSGAEWMEFVAGLRWQVKDSSFGWPHRFKISVTDNHGTHLELQAEKFVDLLQAVARFRQEQHLLKEVNT